MSQYLSTLGYICPKLPLHWPSISYSQDYQNKGHFIIITIMVIVYSYRGSNSAIFIFFTSPLNKVNLVKGKTLQREKSLFVDPILGGFLSRETKQKSHKSSSLLQKGRNQYIYKGKKGHKICFPYLKWMFCEELFALLKVVTVIILNIGTDRSEQTVQTQIRLLLMEQSDQGLLCLLFCLHLLNTILHCKIQLFQM